MHTCPVSKCGKATVFESLTFYKKMEYDGVFITNHFLDGNINIDFNEPYYKKLKFYFSDYEEAIKISSQIGIKVFLGVEMSFEGTDFLIYGLEPEWYFKHPEIMDMNKNDELNFLRDSGAIVIHAHPYRDVAYSNDIIRLLPRCVDGVEVLNGCRSKFENKMAKKYAESYKLLMTAGSDNHIGEAIEHLAGIETVEPLNSCIDFINAIKNKKTQIFEIIK